MKPPARYSTALLKIWPVIAFLMVFACAPANKPAQKPPQRTYKVGLINAGVYSSLFNKAAADLGAFAEIRLIAGPDLSQLLARQDFGKSRLKGAGGFAEVSDVSGLDFALILMPPPAAYPVGAVGLKSINWRTKTVNTVPAVEIPKYPYEWLIDAKNGWAIIRTDPPGAYLEINGKPEGSAPMLLMAGDEAMKIEARWKKKIVTSDYYEVPAGGRILIRAPKEYRQKLQEKGFYQKLKEADEKYGPMFFIGFYVAVLVGGIVLLFYSPKPF